MILVTTLALAAAFFALLAVHKGKQTLKAHVEKQVARRKPNPSTYTGPLYNRFGREIGESSSNARRAI